MKIAPITRAIKAAQEAGKKISYRLIYTGRQDDTSLDASLFSDLDMKRPDGYLGVTGHDHSEVAAAIMLAFEKELNNHPAQVVLVVDDLTATMSCSIVAKKRGLKVAAPHCRNPFVRYEYAPRSKPHHRSMPFPTICLPQAW